MRVSDHRRHGRHRRRDQPQVRQGGPSPRRLRAPSRRQPVGDIVDKIDFEQGDVLDMPRILQAIKKHQVTHVVHAAAFVGAVSAANPALSIQVNVHGAGQRAGGCSRARTSSGSSSPAPRVSTGR